MNNGELVSRVSNQLRMVSKDEYISDRLILSTAKSIALKFITQKIQRRSIDRSMDLFKEIQCIEFEAINSFSCKYVEFRNCKTLYRSKKKTSDLGLIFTRYGSSIKSLYSIDRSSTVLTESTLQQLVNDSEREGGGSSEDKFYILDDYIYITVEAEVLSGLFLNLDLYEAEEFCGCSEDCKSAWDFEFVAPDSMLEDVIGYTVQQLSVTKSIAPDEKPDLNENSK